MTDILLSELKYMLAQSRRDNLETKMLQRVIECGRPFTRIVKPKGFRWRKEKQCFYNSLTTVFS